MIDIEAEAKLLFSNIKCPIVHIECYVARIEY